MPFTGIRERTYNIVLEKWIRPHFENFLVNILHRGPIPAHVAFIMDGNRRYAKKHGIPTVKGHGLGAKAMDQAIENCSKCGVKAVTVYVFSIENFNRSKEQVKTLMDLFRTHSAQYTEPEPNENRKLRVLGRLDLLPNDIRERLEAGVENTKDCKGIFLNVCVAYTSRDEITTAIRKTVKDEWRKNITEASLTENMFTVDSPPLDLLIRTSAVHRLSDFLLWQCHQDTYIEVVDALWPEFGMWNLFWILLKWQRVQAFNNSGGCLERTKMMAAEWRSKGAVSSVLFAFTVPLALYFAFLFKMMY